MKVFSHWKVLFQKKMLVILALGFSSGLPLGITGTTLQAWYTMEGVDLVTIGFLALIGQPYVYKFLWAPVVDRVSPPFWRHRRGWLLLLQLGLIVATGIMAGFSPRDYPVVLAMIALGVAVLSATQDIVIDALRTEMLTESERGFGASMTVSGYRIAMLVSGGLSLVIAGTVGFQATYIILALSLVIGVAATWVATEPSALSRKGSGSWLGAFRDPLLEFVRRPHWVAILALLILYKLGDAFAASLTTTFLLRGVGFTLAEAGFINKTVGLVAVLLGTLVGGALLTRMPLWRALMVFGLAQALTNISYAVLGVVGHHIPTMVSAVFIENFAGGLGTAAFLSFIMAICNKQFTAAQFALFSAFSAVGRVFVGPISGLLVEELGWVIFFVTTFVFSLPGLMVLYYLKDALVFKAPQPVEGDEILVGA